MDTTVSVLLLFSVCVFAHLGSTQAIASDDLCPPCYVREANNSDCVCTHTLPKGICYCYEKEGSQSASLAHGYCMTYSNTTGLVTVGKCLATSEFGGTSEVNYPGINLPAAVFELDNETCKPFNREGELCNECVSNYGLPVFGSPVNCTRCAGKDGYFSWLLFVLFNFLPITVLFVIIALFDVKLTKPPLLEFIIYSQVLVVILQYNPRIYTQLSLWNSNRFRTLLQIVVTLYGVWNLDFFQFLKPPFCLGESLRVTDLLVLHYLVAVYPIVLIMCAWICIALYTRGFKPMILVWKLTKGLLKSKLFFFLKYIPKQQFGTIDIANAMAAFITLAYSKILTVSACLLFVSPIYAYNTTHQYGDFEHSKDVLLFDSSVDSFGKHHLPYAIVAIICLLLFILLPLLLLLLYPIKCLRKIRPLSNCLILHHFIERFQGWFKDGTDVGSGSRDFRLASTIHPLLRIFVVISLFIISIFYVPSVSNLNISLTWVIPGIIWYCLSLFFTYAQPYKLSYNDINFNTFDSLFFGFLTVLCLLLASEGGSYIAIFLGMVPLVMGLSYVIYIVLKWINVWCFLQKKVLPLFKSVLADLQKKIKAICCSRKERNFNEELPDRIVNSGRYNRAERRYTDVSNAAGLHDSLVL